MAGRGWDVAISAQGNGRGTGRRAGLCRPAARERKPAARVRRRGVAQLGASAQRSKNCAGVPRRTSNFELLV